MKKLVVFSLICFSFLNFNLFAQDESESNIASEETESNTVSEEAENKDKIPEYESIIDESNKLHLFSYKDENLEYLTINNRKDDKTKTVTVASGSRIIRYFYDSDFYLSKVEIWSCEKSAKDAVLLKVFYYEYPETNKDSEEKTSSYSKKVMEYDLKNQRLIESYYNSVNNLVSEKKEYDFFDVKENSLIYKPEFKNKNRLSYSYIYKYDEQDRIILDSFFHYEYRTSNTKKVLKKSYRKNVYEYVRVDCPPVTSFYENDILRMKTVYTSNNDYVTYVYFDHNTYVKVEYKNARKVSEIFYVNQEEKVRKIYE